MDSGNEWLKICTVLYPVQKMYKQLSFRKTRSTCIEEWENSTEGQGSQDFEQSMSTEDRGSRLQRTHENQTRDLHGLTSSFDIAPG